MLKGKGNKLISPFISLILVCVVSVLFIVIGNKISYYSPTEGIHEQIETAVVLGNINVRTESGIEDVVARIISFDGEITSGEYKGKKVTMEQIIDEMLLPVPKQVEVGDKIVIVNSKSMIYENSNVEWHYAGINRIPIIIWLVVLFFVLILIIGGLKGITTIISLLITIAAIFGVYIPSILSGKNIYVSTIIVTSFIILSSLFALNGFNKKTFCAIIGNIGGILVAGFLTLFFNSALEITGMIDQEYIFLTMLNGNISIDLRAVVWGGILVGSLGAIMDVSMSIASSMYELSIQMKRKSFGMMVHSGMNIGRDAIGTMTNTLILAYVGSSIAIVLLYTAYNRNFLAIINSEMIVVEIIQAIVGSIGILLAVPITVFFSAWIFNKKDRRDIGQL